jgi:hypothetical protein
MSRICLSGSQKNRVSQKAMCAELRLDLRPPSPLSSLAPGAKTVHLKLNTPEPPWELSNSITHRIIVWSLFEPVEIRKMGVCSFLTM